MSIILIDYSEKDYYHLRFNDKYLLVSRYPSKHKTDLIEFN